MHGDARAMRLPTGKGLLQEDPEEQLRNRHESTLRKWFFDFTVMFAGS
jgi:hypothetical protein